MKNSYYCIYNLKMINTWYQNLNKPDYIPPETVFTSLWTTLYILMFASVIIISGRTSGKQRNNAIALFLVQFILNIMWSFVFFEMHSLLGAFLVLCLLYFFLAATIAYFYKYSKLSAILLLPYFLWLNVAGYLNFRLLLTN